jgi:acyl CoA:acetate/3-ketoacid CoA transferase alpha subunit/acyl CoA:acetate/3-ketoacid CoA transferase beta subunit
MYMAGSRDFPLVAGGPIDRAALDQHWRQRLSSPAAVQKVIPLAEAISDSIQPGDAVYLGGSLARPNGATFELVRQLYGTSPGLTIIAPALGNQHAILVRTGLVAKAITSLHGNTYPAPGPNRVFTEADRTGEVKFEDWSMLTLVLRLYAAATNSPFLPTRSLVGSDLGRELSDAGLMRLVDDPFGNGGQSALVAPLHPDVTIVHSLMADANGNAVISPPYYEDAWAAFAARRRVIVTTEKLVSTEVIRRYAQFVRVPGAYVSWVCEVPFGSHPNQVPGDLVPEVGGYRDDYEFLDELRVSCQDPTTLDAWIKRWILGVRSQEDYLEQLGAARLSTLRDKTRPDGWLNELAMLNARWGDPASPGECNAVLGARYLRRLIKAEGLRVGLAGVGISTLAAWLAGDSLRGEGIPFDLLAEGGMYGYTPMPLDPYLFNYRNVFTSTSLSNVQTILGVVAGGYANRAVGVLGAAQVDSHGAINTSRIGGRMLTGSGGGNDIASSSSAVVVTTVHSRARLPETVEFVTSPGHRVRAIVTDRAVIERRVPESPFVLTGVLDRDGAAKDALIRDAVDRCGWPLLVAEDVEVLVPVDGEELAAVRTYDPTGNFVL